MAKTYTQPNNTTQSGSVYKAAIDDGMAVLAEIGQDFAPHQATTANLTVLVDAGKIIKADGTLVSVAQQTATFVAPATNPRIDRIVIDMVTGIYSIIAGTEAASPTAPAITAGKLPCAQVALSVGQTQITNINITDERTTFVNYDARYALLAAGNSFTTARQNFYVDANNSAIRIGSSSTNNGGYLTSSAGDSVYLSAGAELVGGSWTARATEAGIFGIATDGALTYNYNSGLTPGNTFSPTDRLGFDSTGKMTAGTVPLARSQRTEVSSTTGTADLGTVNTGDRIWVTGVWRFSTTGSGGHIGTSLDKGGGTATIEFASGETNITYYFTPSAAGTFFQGAFGVCKVTAGGTLTMRVTGLNTGSLTGYTSISSGINAIVINNG